METQLIEDLQTQGAVLTLLNRLRLGSFRDSLSKQPTKAMDDIQIRAKKYIYLEKTKKSTASKKEPRCSNDELSIGGAFEKRNMNTEGWKV